MIAPRVMVCLCYCGVRSIFLRVCLCVRVLLGRKKWRCNIFHGASVSALLWVVMELRGVSIE